MVVSRWCALLLVLVQLTFVSLARADNLADEADLQFQLGAEAYTQGDFKRALEHFLSSNRLVGNRNVVFNIARCYEQLAQFPNAWRYYRDALEKAPDEAARKKIGEALTRVAPNVAVLEISSEPPDATVYIDRKELGPRGESPESLGLSAGRYTVIIEKVGYEPAQQSGIEIKAGETRSVSLSLKPILGRVRIDGTRGALIRLDGDAGQIVGKVPSELSLPVGPHRLFFSAPGKKVRELPIEVKTGATLGVRADLEQTFGALVVSSDLRDALIQIDGQPSGFSPAVVQVPTGRHHVRVSLSGFTALERDVIIAEGRQTRLDVELARGEQVTAASRTEEQVERAPSSVTIISREELRAMGYQTIAEAVRGVRGLYLTDDRSYTTVGVRGSSRPGDYGNKILILYDGHPYNENILGQSFPGLEGRSDLDDVQRIEVVRGPGSVLYGTGAFFGVINLVTHGRDQRTRGELGVAAHEYGVTRGRAFGYARIPNGAVWASASAFRGAGRDFYFPEYRDDASGLAGNARGIDGVKGGTVQGRVWWKALTLQWFYHRRDKELPTGEYEVLFGDSRNVFIDKRGFAELRFEPKLSEQVQLLTRAHANIYEFKSTAPYAPADGGLVSETYNGRWVGLEQRIAYQPIGALRLTFGGEVQRHFRASMSGKDETGAVYLPEDSNRYWVAGVYGVSDVDIASSLRLSGGLRFDYFRWQFAERDVKNSAVNPRIALIWTPYQAGVTKLMLGKAFRAPSIYERFYQSSVQATSLDLEPEQVVTGELEHTHRFTRDVMGVAAGYANYVTNLVVGRGDGTDASPLRFVNSPTPVLTFGGELELRRVFRDGFMFAGTYSIQKSSYVNPDAGDGLEPGAHVPNSPMHTASLKGAAPIVGRALGAMTRLSVTSERYDRNETVSDPPQGTTSPGIVWDLVLNGNIMDERVHYNLGVYNIADYRYQGPVSGEFRMRSVTQNGRTVLAALTLTL